MTVYGAPDVGDPVTWIDNDAVVVILIHARWSGHRDDHKSFADSYKLKRIGMAGEVVAAWVALADEGRTWCRGHVNEKSEAGAALLAGAALARSPADRFATVGISFTGRLTALHADPIPGNKEP